MFAERPRQLWISCVSLYKPQLQDRVRGLDAQIFYWYFIFTRTLIMPACYPSFFVHLRQAIYHDSMISERAHAIRTLILANEKFAILR